MAIVKISLVLLTVLVTLTTAMLLNYGAKESNLFSVSAGLIIFTVLVINFIKFKVWGVIYKRFHLSESYPLIALFFPLIYIVAIFNGDAIFEIKKVVGVILIILGIFVMHSKKAKI